MKKIINVYQENAKIPKSKISDILKRDLWWDAKGNLFKVWSC